MSRIEYSDVYFARPIGRWQVLELAGRRVSRSWPRSMSIAVR
jgi:hypothetical protein